MRTALCCLVLSTGCLPAQPSNDGTNTDPGWPGSGSSGTGDTEGVGGAETGACTGTFTLTMNGGQQLVLDSCEDLTASASYQFTDTATPQLRAFTAAWYTYDDGTDCSVHIRQGGVCGTGYYDTVAPSAEVGVHAWGCDGMSESSLGQYEVVEGYIQLTQLDTGEQVGALAGQDIPTTLNGRVEGTLENGWVLRGDFGFAADLVGETAPQSPCLAIEADADGDGYDDESYGGSDCDDDDPDIHPAGTDIPGDGIDQDCSGDDEWAPGEVTFEPLGWYVEFWTGWFGGPHTEEFTYEGDTIFPYVQVTFGDEDYFDTGSGDTCTWIGLIDELGSHELGLVGLWAGFEVELVEWDTDCQGMDPALWGAEQTPRAVLEATTWGLGYGPISDDLASRLSGALGSSWGTYRDYVYGAWVAVEDRDTGALEGFEANWAVTYQTDASGEIVRDSDGYLTLEAPRGDLPEGAVGASPYYAAATEGVFHD